MFAQSDLVYLYDGTTDGFLCCVFESFLSKETPADILLFDSWQPCLFWERSIETDPERAGRVRRWLEARERKNTYAVLRRAWLTALPQKELHLLRFLQLAQEKGEKAWEQVQESSVMALHAAFTTLGRELDKYMGFVRFSDYGGVLVGVIEPKNFVLPLLQSHFCGRLGEENFLLYDKTHATALVSRRGAGRLVPLDGLELPAPDAAEASPTDHAGLGCPVYFTQWNIH